ncbi:MAG: glutamate--tRNA ligase [Prevotellaceae bacterium]|jgi:glutamyl-tRNA synthetase|nr:glutamate--tRNA ligase [Prevotellaceae bacterium]
MNKIRVRFAPSPTGPLHIGGVRTALFNWLFARKYGGDFILRIEDTDSARFVPGAEDYIIESLKWCGIDFDEGPGLGGPHAPYRQSERKEIYFKFAEQLVNDGFAYYAFDKPEELDALRKQYEAEGKTFIYNHELRYKLRTSLALAPEESERLKKETNDWVVRFMIPANETVTINDMVRGEVSVNTSVLDDKVLWKKIDELPTYHLANIVDDRLMEITHVIRGEEWLPSLPLHVLLYRAFGWEAERPQFAHLSLLLRPDGKGKLSKRDGDRLGFPVFPLKWTSAEGELTRAYREDGYFPEAFVNILALLGWNPGIDQEIFTKDELTQLFDLDRVVKSGARFNPDKAKWFNQQYMKIRNNEELAQLFMPELVERGISASAEYVAKVCGLIKERATFVSDFWSLSSYFFVAPESYDEKAVKKFVDENTGEQMKALAEILQEVSPFTAELSEQAVHEWINVSQFKIGRVMNAFRLCIVGASMGPSMFEITATIGQEETLKRIDAAVEKIMIGDK